MAQFSPSSLSTYETCPLQFWFEKKQSKIKGKEEEPVFFFLGHIVHTVFEKLYKDLMHEKENSLQDLLTYLHETWAKTWNKNIVIYGNYTEENYKKMAVKMITEYYNRYKPFKQARTLGTELNVRAKLNKELAVHGRLDRLDYKDGVYEIHDYKTGQGLPGDEHFDQDRQLGAYALCIADKFRDAKLIKLVWHYTAHDKEFESKRTKAQLEKLRKDILKLAQKIDSDTTWRPVVGNHCQYCDYQPKCPKWKHMFKTEQLPVNEYLKEQGVVLVDKLVEKDAKVKELIDDIEKIKEAILAYAEKHGYDAVFGSLKNANISKSENIKLPAKDDEKREELIKLLKSFRKWEQLSDLDIHLLKKMIEEQALEPELMKKLKKFYTIETSKSVRLVKKKEE